jgi:hypothetical protein
MPNASDVKCPQFYVISQDQKISELEVRMEQMQSDLMRCREFERLVLPPEALGGAGLCAETQALPKTNLPIANWADRDSMDGAPLSSLCVQRDDCSTARHLPQVVPLQEELKQKVTMINELRRMVSSGEPPSLIRQFAGFLVMKV